MVHDVKMASLSHDGFILQITVQELKEKIVEKMVSCSRKKMKKAAKKDGCVHSQIKPADWKSQRVGQI